MLVVDQDFGKTALKDVFINILALKTKGRLQGGLIYSNTQYVETFFIHTAQLKSNPKKVIC